MHLNILLVIFWLTWVFLWSHINLYYKYQSNINVSSINLRQGTTWNFSARIISWNTVSGAFHETWNNFMKYFVYIFHCVYFSSIKNCVYREQVCCKSKKNQKDQRASEWNHDWKTGATKVQYIFRTSVN